MLLNTSDYILLDYSTASNVYCATMYYLMGFGVEKWERVGEEVDVYTPCRFYLFLILTKQYSAKDCILPKKRPKYPYFDQLQIDPSKKHSAFSCQMSPVNTGVISCA